MSLVLFYLQDPFLDKILVDIINYYYYDHKSYNRIY
jgi:hypothetical protein